jgi:outer membrane immunogenic protein
MKSRLIAAVIGATALLVSTLAGQAADIPRKGPVYTPDAPAYFSWTGFYVGINGGYAWGTADWPAPPPPSVSFNTTGFLVGATLGYNYQMGSFVLGAEGDWDFSTIKGSLGGCCETKVPWIATGRARLGYAWDRWLPYVTGGVAFASIKNTGVGSETANKLGWTAGVGVEYAFMSAWSVKAEYLYADLGSMTCDACFAGQTVKWKTSIARAGLNYRF